MRYVVIVMVDLATPEDHAEFDSLELAEAAVAGIELCRGLAQGMYARLFDRQDCCFLDDRAADADYLREQGMDMERVAAEAVELAYVTKRFGRRS